MLAIFLAMTVIGYPGTAVAQTNHHRAHLDTVTFDQHVSYIRWVFPGPHQTVLVGAEPENVVFMVAPTGIAKRVGREGQGPGEHGRIGSAAIRGDSVVIFDRGRQNFAIIDIASTTGRTVRFTELRRSEACNVLREGPSGGICERLHVDPTTRRPDAIELHWFMHGASSALPEPFVQYDPREVTGRMPLAGGTLNVHRPFHWAQRYSTSPSANLTARLVQERLQGDQVLVKVAKLRLSNGAIDSWQTGALSLRLSKAAVQRIVRARRESSTQVAAELSTRRESPSDEVIRQALALPEFLPPYVDIAIGDDECVWLRRASSEIATQEADATYDVFDEAGRRLHVITVPGRVALSSVSCRDALGVQYGSDEAETIVRITW